MYSQDLRQTERRFVEAAKLLDAVQQKKMYVERERLRAQITLQELETPSNSIYQSVGKMFIVVPADDVKKELTETVAQAEKQIKDIERQEKSISESLKKAQDELRAKRK